MDSQFQQASSQILSFNELFRKVYPLDSLVSNVNLKSAKLEKEWRERENAILGADLKKSTLGASKLFSSLGRGKINLDMNDTEVEEQEKRRVVLKMRAD